MDNVYATYTQEWGIGNKLHTLINAMICCDEIYKIKCNVHWIPRDEKTTVDKIFDINKLNINFVENDRNKYKFNFIEVAQKKMLIKKLCVGFVCFNNEIKYIDQKSYKNKYPTLSYLYDRSPSYFINKIQKYVSQFVPTDELLNEINNFKTNNFSSYMIGIHVRLGDKIRNQKDKNIHIKGLADMINKTEKPSNFKLFICCDEDYGYEYMKNIYGNIVCHINQNDLSNYNEEQISVIDMYLLSMCDEMMCHVGSTFSEMAWWIGGCKKISVLH